ncbi:Transcriptional regulatory protein sin3 [Lobulomyces angularis]|nr:Transcriptional regulatory protein sin3 [Lobulomyces angularis]
MNVTSLSNQSDAEKNHVRSNKQNAANLTALQQQPSQNSSLSTAQVAISLTQSLPNTSTQDQSETTTYRQLNVRDALTYLDQVKIQFEAQSEVYSRFLDIMKDFKSQSIDTPAVIERVSTLFRGHSHLITGFNTFLPPGYRVEATNNPLDPIIVTTPNDQVGHAPNYRENSATIISSSTQNYTTEVVPTRFKEPTYQSVTQSGNPPFSSHNLSLHNPNLNVSLPPMLSANEKQPASTPILPSFSHSHSPPVTINTPSLPQLNNSERLPPLPVPYISHVPQPVIPQIHQHNSFSTNTQQSHQQLPLPTLPPPQVNQQQPPAPTPLPPQPPVAPVNAAATRAKPNVEFNHAINYVNKIKTRFAPQPDIYKQFLEILQTYKQSKPIQEVYAEVENLFQGAPDLLDEFKQFLPDPNSNNNSNRPTPNAPASTGHSGGLRSNGMEVLGSPTNVNRSFNKRSNNSGSGNLSASGSYNFTTQSAQPTQPPKKKTKSSQKSANLNSNINQSVKLEELDATKMEELDFFDKVKKAINYKQTYNEFLKVLNLFSQEIIDSKTLIERVFPYLEKSPDLFDWFKKFVKYEEEDVVVNEVAVMPRADPGQFKLKGKSYRLLPKDFARGTCSGRDERCAEVLNDDWMSHPLFTSENGHFSTSKKNAYEEALHKCEEERYDFDLNIEANLHAISIFEPIELKLSEMSVEERNNLKYPNGLCEGASKAIYQRVIKKIYDKDRGLEVIEALHQNPAVAVPVVLKRLKQKDEEWKRSQREWNKVWLEIDALNFVKSLDYQGENFKSFDKKTLSSKTLLSEIEQLYKEQKEKMSSNSESDLLANNCPKYQYDFHFKDQELFRNCRELIVRSLEVISSNNNENGNGNNLNLGIEKENLNKFLRDFFGKFFWNYFEEFGEDEIEDFEFREDLIDTNNDEEDSEDCTMEDINNNYYGTDTEDDHSSKNFSIKKKKGRNLRRKMMIKRVKENRDSSRAKKNLQDSVISNASSSVAPQRSSYTFYANSQIFVFFRQFQILYSRLYKIMELSKELAENPPKVKELNNIAVNLGLQKESDIVFKEEERFPNFIVNLYELLEGTMDSSEFEERSRAMFSTSAYLTFTLDKLSNLVAKTTMNLLNDQTSLKLFDMFYEERLIRSTSSHQEQIYRSNVESCLGDDNLFRIEYFVAEKVATVQLLCKDDKVYDESISSEEKWSVYVDHFVQLGTISDQSYLYNNKNQSAENSSYQGYGNPPFSLSLKKKKTPFLKRNLPKLISDDPPINVQTKSGLELKICVNTYKIFFVDNTEDYFCRLHNKATNEGKNTSEQEKKKKIKVSQWLENKCWSGIDEIEKEKLKKNFTEKFAISTKNTDIDTK